MPFISVLITNTMRKKILSGAVLIILAAPLIPFFSALAHQEGSAGAEESGEWAGLLFALLIIAGAVVLRRVVARRKRTLVETSNS